MDKAVDLGLLTSDEFIARRSVRLTQNSAAKLNESDEIDKYISGFDIEYLDEVKSLSSIDTRPLPKSVRAIVTIVAYDEGARIRKTLDTYTNQSIDKSAFEIILLDNHPENQDQDNTYDEVQKFSVDNPDISVVYAHKVWGSGEIATIGSARKYVFDIALARIHHRNSKNQDTVLVSNDADTVSLGPDYLALILDEFKTNETVDALVTQTVVPSDVFKKPNIFAAASLWDAIDNRVAEGEPRNLIGRSCAYRASIYAAIGGYNPKGKMAGDLETGFMIADARAWNPDSVILFDKAKHVTDPRRFLETVASRVPINEMYYKFASSPEVRNVNNNTLLGLIPDNLDWELFEEDANSFWAGRVTGMYKWRGERFRSDYKNAMNDIGVEYEVVDDRLKITNIDRLLAKYEQEFGYKPQVVHSKPRAEDQQRGDEMRRYFSTVSDSAIGSREKMAQKIADNIENMQGDDEAGVDYLRMQYRRFAGRDYVSKDVSIS